MNGVDGRLDKVAASAKTAKEKATRKAYAELDELRSKAVTAMREFMKTENKTGDQLFADIDGAGPISSSKFVSFLEGLPDLNLEDGKGVKLFEHIAEGEPTI